MKLYCTPGGTWAGTEADYKKALKAEGGDAKSVSRTQVEVPTDKKGLLEFLTFHHVNPIGGRIVSQVVGDGATPLPPPAPSPAAPAAPTTSSASVADQVETLPITAQIDILVGIADRAHKAIYKANQ